MNTIKSLWTLSALLIASPVIAQEADVKGVESGGTSGLRTAVGPDPFGYTAADETEPTGAPFNFLDISGTGTALGLSGDDAGSAAVNIGFNFDFYGTTYTQFGVSTNGYINFNPAGDLVDFGNDCPGLNAFDPDQSLYVYWDDLIINAPGDVYVQTFATCPVDGGGFDSCTIVQWDEVAHLGSAVTWDMQAILYDNGNILTQYPAGNDETGDGGTIGIENETPSTIGLDYACNTPGSIPASRSVLFCAPGNTCPPIGSDAVVTPSVPNMTPVTIQLSGNGTGVGSIGFANAAGSTTDGTLDSCSLASGIDFSITGPAFPATIAPGATVNVTLSAVDNGLNPTDTLTCSFTDSNGTTTVTYPLGVAQAQTVPTLSFWGIAIAISLILMFGLMARRIGVER